MKNKIEKWYRQGLWTEAMVRNAVIKGVITREDYEVITGNPYEEAGEV